MSFHSRFGVCGIKYRGVSSTVKLSVSKTELLGSNPSAPAKLFTINVFWQ